MRTWQELETACKSCRSCALGDTRANVVFGYGDKNADVLFVGEGPGEQEDKTGLPFVGRAGKLLDEMLLSIGITRDDVYIANIVKCRPPGNRDPLNIERDACMPWLREQTRLINPKIIVALGRVAAISLLQRKDYSITREHGQFEQRGNFHITATFHPAFLLRDPRKKPEAFADLCAIEDKIKELIKPGSR